MNLEGISLSILPGKDGGLIVYELVDNENHLVFGGNLEEVSKYLTGRMSKIVISTDQVNRAAHIDPIVKSLTDKPRRAPSSQLDRLVDKLAANEEDLVPLERS